MTGAAAPRAGASTPARLRLRALPWILAVAALALAADQAAKAVVLHHRAAGTEASVPPAPRVLVPEVLEITFVRNRGTTFGWFPESPLVGLLPWATAALSLGLLWGWTRLAHPPGRWAGVGMGLLVGGAAGNVFDRVIRGYVVDFIHLRADRIPWVDGPIFNLADVLILVGGVLVLLRETIDARHLEP